MRLLAPLLAGLLGGLPAGCAAERLLTVESDPPGAEIRLDDRRRGHTPATFDFGHYGIRRVTLHLDGYRTFTERIELSPPWYARFPFDLVSEVLIPVGWRDRRELRVRLEPGEEVLSRPGLRSVLERADVLRRAGPAGPQDLPRPLARELPGAPETAEGDGFPPPPPPEEPEEPEEPRSGSERRDGERR